MRRSYDGGARMRSSTAREVNPLQIDGVRDSVMADTEEAFP